MGRRPGQFQTDLRLRQTERCGGPAQLLLEISALEYEYRYYIALGGSVKFASGLTAPQVMTQAVADTGARDECGDNAPRWFLAKPLSHYTMWMPKNSGRYRVFRDEDDGTLYVCDEQL